MPRPAPRPSLPTHSLSTPPSIPLPKPPTPPPKPPSAPHLPPQPHSGRGLDKDSFVGTEELGKGLKEMKRGSKVGVSPVAVQGVGAGGRRGIQDAGADEKVTSLDPSDRHSGLPVPTTGYGLPSSISPSPTPLPPKISSATASRPTKTLPSCTKAVQRDRDLEAFRIGKPKLTKVARRTGMVKCMVAVGVVLIAGGVALALLKYVFCVI